MSKTALALLSLPLLLSSCDEGRLYEAETVGPEAGGVVRFRSEIVGQKTWTADYTLAVAGFAEGSEYALISKNIDGSAAEGRCDLVLTGIPENVSSIELCALDRLRRRVAVFTSADYKTGRDTFFVDSPKIDLSMAGAIQREILNPTCVQCHGRSNFAAAGLDLTERRSFGSLISVPSVKCEDLDRVEPGRSDRSVLYMILSGDVSSTWNYDHSVEVVRQEKLELIKNWIDGGAHTE